MWRRWKGGGRPVQTSTRSSSGSPKKTDTTMEMKPESSIIIPASLSLSLCVSACVLLVFSSFFLLSFSLAFPFFLRDSTWRHWCLHFLPPKFSPKFSPYVPTGLHGPSFHWLPSVGTSLIGFDGIGLDFRSWCVFYILVSIGCHQFDDMLTTRYVSNHLF